MQAKEILHNILGVTCPWMHAGDGIGGSQWETFSGDGIGSVDSKRSQREALY